MNIIKTAIPYLIGGSLFFGASNASAQMTGGRIVQYAIEQKVNVNAPLSRVWDSLSDPSVLPRYAGDYFSAAVRQGNSSEFDFTLKSGTVVKGHVNYIDPKSDDRFCVITLDTPLQEGIQNIEWLLTVKNAPDGNGVIVRWAAIIDGSEEAKETVKKELSGMFDDYFKGLSEVFQVKNV